MDDPAENATIVAFSVDFGGVDVYAVTMKWVTFHHPDISLPVLRRKAGEELVSLIGGTAAMILSRGASEVYGHCYPSRDAYYASLARLRKRGLVVQSKTDGSMPGLRLTEAGTNRLPPYSDPQRFWNQKWNGWWYVLMFDVPEKDRAYRDELRKFLKRERLGCLQRSVWVTPRDIRPEYADLDRAAAIDSIAFLFESRTVLGHGNQSVVQEAWNFDRIKAVHERYIGFANENLGLLDKPGHSDEELAQLLRMEDQAYGQAMCIDPLLPSELFPKGYAGREAFGLHQEILKRIARAFQ